MDSECFTISLPALFLQNQITAFIRVTMGILVVHQEGYNNISSFKLFDIYHAFHKIYVFRSCHAYISVDCIPCDVQGQADSLPKDKNK
jgi:hypothetical protein